MVPFVRYPSVGVLLVVLAIALLMVNRLAGQPSGQSPSFAEMLDASDAEVTGQIRSLADGGGMSDTASFADIVSAAESGPLAPGSAATTSGSRPVSLSINLNGAQGGEDLSVAIQLVFLMTLLTLAPSLVVLMTSFTRIVIVLGFVRNAIGVHGAPSNQIIIGLALFLSIFLMAPTWEGVYNDAIEPYMADTLDSRSALDAAAVHLKDFMLRQTRPADVEFFLGLTGSGPTASEDLPLRIVVPSFVLSELRTAFQMGFLIFVPFLIIDFIVASTLMAMGMMMMPPAILSLPFKLLLFVLVDGWYLVVKSLVESFAV